MQSTPKVVQRTRQAIRSTPLLMHKTTSQQLTPHSITQIYRKAVKEKRHNSQYRLKLCLYLLNQNRNPNIVAFIKNKNKPKSKVINCNKGIKVLFHILEI